MKRDRLRSAFATSLLMVCLACGAPGESPPAPRNVILISLDTLRADHLGCYGYERNTSPNLDALARRSTLFEHAVSQAPNTKPSHASLFTSLYYSVHRAVGDKKAAIPRSQRTLPEILREHGFATWGFVDGGYLTRRFGFGRGFDHYGHRKTGFPSILARATRWLNDHSPPRFFLFLHTYDIHTPYQPPAPFDTFFEETPYTGDFEPDADSVNDVAQFRRKISPEDVQHALNRYDGGIRYVDSLVGKFLGVLERRGLMEDSIVIVTSDHGEEFMEHGSMLHWKTYYRPNLNVPLIIYVPGREPRVVPQTVESIDVLPTILDLLDLPPHPEAMGRSLVPLMDGETSDEFEEHAAYAEPFLLSMPQRTVVTRTHQLIQHQETGEIELFDLRSDPLSQRDVADEQPEVAAALLAQLNERRERIAGMNRGTTEPDEPAAEIDPSMQEELRQLGYVE